MVDTISYIVPAHNDSTTLASTVGTIVERLDADFPGSEVLIVENGSSDDTAAVAAELTDRAASRAAADPSTASVAAGSDRSGRSVVTAVRHLTSSTGLGNAMRVGVGASTGDLVVMAGGLAFGFTDLDAVLAMQPRPRFAIGSKAHPDSQLERPLLRRVSTGGFKVLRRVILHTDIGDSQGSFIIEGALARTLFPLTVEMGYTAQAEVVMLAELAGIRIAEVPVVLHQGSDRSSVRPVRTSAEMFAGLLRLRRRRERMRRELVSVGLAD